METGESEWVFGRSHLYEVTGRFRKRRLPSGWVKPPRWRATGPTPGGYGKMGDDSSVEKTGF